MIGGAEFFGTPGAEFAGAPPAARNLRKNQPAFAGRLHVFNETGNRGSPPSGPRQGLRWMKPVHGMVDSASAFFCACGTFACYLRACRTLME